MHLSPLQRHTLAVATLLALTGCNLKLATAPTSTAVAGKTKLTQDQALAKMKSSGKVTLSFKGLSSRKVMATSDDVASVTLKLTGTGGFSATKTLQRKDMLATLVTTTFENVPAGKVSLEVKAFDASHNPLGSGLEDSEVKAGQTAQINLAVKLSDLATGSVNANISFEDATYAQNDLTGIWVLGIGDEPPAGPVIACSAPTQWTVSQTGNDLYAVTNGHNPPEHPTHPNVDYVEIVQGKVKNGAFQLEGEVTYYGPDGRQVGDIEKVKYEVSYNANTGHITGLRNGQKGWAAPFLYDDYCFGTPGPSATPFYGPTPGPYGSDYPYPSATPTYSYGSADPNNWGPTPGPYGTANPDSVSTTFAGLSDDQLVNRIFALYDNNYDGALDFAISSDSNESFRYEARRIMGPDGMITQAVSWSIDALLNAADSTHDHRVSRDELTKFVKANDSDNDGKPDPSFLEMYNETVFSINVY